MKNSTAIEKLKASNELPFTDILSKEAINKHTKGIEWRKRVFSPDVTIFAFLSQVISADHSCQKTLAQVIAHLSASGQKAPSANTAAYCKARSRLPEKTLSGLAQDCGAELEANAKPEWLWRKRHVKMVDGSTVSMPDTKANQSTYPQPGTQKKGVGFPIARVVAVISLAVGAVLDFAIGPYTGKGTGEHGLLRQLMHVFKPEDIALGDCYYASFFFGCDADANGSGRCVSASRCAQM
jgi:hypothetical protein